MHYIDHHNRQLRHKFLMRLQREARRPELSNVKVNSKGELVR